MNESADFKISKWRFDQGKISAQQELDDMSSSDLSELSESDDDEPSTELEPELGSCQSKDVPESEESVGPEPEEMPTWPLTVEEDEGPLPLFEQAQSAEERLPKKKQHFITTDEERRKARKDGPAARDKTEQNRKRLTRKRILTGRGGGARRVVKKARKEESQHAKWANDKKWEKKFNPRQIPQFIGKSGPQMRRTSLPEQLNAKVFFELLFTDDVWHLSVDMKNANATAKNAVDWVQTTVPEMKAFLDSYLQWVW